MSIWASVEGPAVEGSSDGGAVEVDVATARSWHDRIRLALISAGGAGDADVELDRTAAAALRDKLSAALDG